MAPSEIDYYKILGLERHAKDEDIKRSFRKLARDTHPDKNPNDPTAKERFQDLQRAYDTLRDNLERSKYDEDNPYHGRDHERSSTSRAQNGTRSGTAKRYATGPSAHTPGWTNGTARGYEGFPQQASSAKPKGWYPYEEYEGKTHSGFTYQTGYRASTSAKPEYEDHTYGTYRAHKKESAYARTSAERTHQASAKYPTHSSSSSSSPRPKSTSGTNPHSGTNTRYASASTNATPAGSGGIADYIRERRAKEMAAEEEKKRKEVEEKRNRERDAQLRREAEEQLKRQEEDRLRKAQERRRAEAAARNPYFESNGYGGRSTPTPTGYPYSYPADIPSPYASRKDEEDLLREVDQKFKERGKSAKPHLSSQSKRRSKSQLKPGSGGTPPSKWANPAFSSHGIPEDWKQEKTGAEDIDVVEATPTVKDSPKDYFTRSPNIGPEYVRKDGTGVYPAPQFSFKDPVTEKSTPTKTHADRPQPTMPGSYGPAGGSPGLSTKEPKSPRRQPSAEQAQESSSDKENKPKPNVFAFQEKSPTPGDDKPVFSKPFDFAFDGGVGARPFGSFTSNNSPEPQCEKSASSGSGAFLRPRSQPTQTQPSFVPPPSAPPNMQQQQKAAATKINSKSKGENTKSRQELLEDLLKQVSSSLEPTSTSATSSAARRKRSAPTLKKQSHTIHRTGSKEAKLDSQPRVESDTEIDEPKSTTQFTKSGFGYEPMEAELTGAPKTIPTPVIPNGKPTIETKKGSSLDMRDIGAVPPLSRSPADVGLGDLESLKNSLPFPSQSSMKSPLSSRVNNKLRTKTPSTSPIGGDPSVVSIPPGFWNLYPQTPLEEPFEVPRAPLVPKIPKQTGLDQYNRFYNSLGSYIEAWNKYEAEVHALRAELTSKSMHVSTTQTLDTQDIVKYMDRVKRKDTILDQSFTKARDKHLNALESWVRLRESVLKEVAHQEQH